MKYLITVILLVLTSCCLFKDEAVKEEPKKEVQKATVVPKVEVVEKKAGESVGELDGNLEVNGEGEKE